MYNVIIVGGGAAGMLSAIGAARAAKEQDKHSSILLLEKNEKVGKKLFITGKGRCNLTNASDIEDILKAVTNNYQFLYSSIYGFTNDDIVSLVEEYGCPTKVERGNRVFPVSDRSSDVIKSLTRAMKAYHVEIRLNKEVKELIIKNDTCMGVVLSDGKCIMAEKVIVATGGLSYPTTGSTGDGYRFAKQAGHNVTPLQPGLVPFVTRENYPCELMGLSLKNVKLKMKYKEKSFYEEQGELLFTHFGVSGPLVLSASAYITEQFKDGIEQGLITGEIDLKPALTYKQLDERILRDFSNEQNKSLKNSLNSLLPKKLIPVIIKLSGIDAEKKVHDITREERQALLKQLKQLTFCISGLRGYDEAIITKGGVDLKYINPQNMESKLVKHLHFAGEVLDLDALTGGYNLQIAWSTGYAAGYRSK